MKDLSAESLQSLRAECREVIKTICHRVAGHEHVPAGLRQLATADDVWTPLQALAQADSEHAKLILHAAVAALVNVQSEMAIDAELKRRANRN